MIRFPFEATEETTVGSEPDNLGRPPPNLLYTGSSIVLKRVSGIRLAEIASAVHLEKQFHDGL